MPPAMSRGRFPDTCLRCTRLDDGKGMVYNEILAAFQSRRSRNMDDQLFTSGKDSSDL